MRIDFICDEINRRIYTMDYKTEKKIREFLEGQADENGQVEPSNYEVEEIAEILDTNTNCIADILGLNEEDEESNPMCKKYTDSEALPDEDGNCSLCGGNCVDEE